MHCEPLVSITRLRFPADFFVFVASCAAKRTVV